MAIDLESDYKNLDNGIRNAQNYIQTKQDIIEIKKNLKDNLEKKKDTVTTQVNKMKEKKKRFEREVKTQLDQLIQLFQNNNGNGSTSTNYLKSKFIEVALSSLPKIFDVLVQESITALGCSQQQTYTPNTAIYIKVQSVDLQGLLFLSPDSTIGKISYEKTTPTVGSIPFSMNQALYNLIQNENTPFSALYGSNYLGASNQALFDIEYTTTDALGNDGNFFKVTLNSKVNSINRVGDFLSDYYKSIQLVDPSNIFAQVMEQLVGSISISTNVGSDKVEMNSEFLLLLQRILGLCFDEKQEIDVSGTAKVGELDGVDQAFFQLTDIDRAIIEQRMTNISLGVVEFEDCENIKLPVDVNSINNQLNLIQNTDSLEEQISLAENLTNVLVSNPAWSIEIPSSLDIKLKADTNFIKELPKALLMAILTPKVLLPIMVLAKSLGQTFVDLIENFDNFKEKMKKFVINMMSKFASIFIRELVEIIKRDIQQLVSQIIAEINTEKVRKIYRIVLKLIQVLTLVLKLVDDYRKCKSVVDELLGLLSLLSGSATGSQIPGPILAATQLLDGFSTTRAFINVIDEYQKLGIPTGPLPDGSPNLFIISKLAEITAVKNEEQENGKAQIWVPPLQVLPTNQTLPTGDVFGKYY